MSLPRPPRDRQRGNSLLLALIVMSALATLGSLTVVSTQSSLKTSTNDRAQTIAMYAAESGAAVAMDFLGKNFNNTVDTQPWGWSSFVVANNIGVVSVPPAQIASNRALPGTPNNPFSADQNAWYDIQLYNNRNDPGFSVVGGPNDQDGRIIIRSTGHGPQSSIAILEWEVQRTDYTRGWPPPQTPFPDPPLPVPPYNTAPPDWGWPFAEPLAATAGPPAQPRAGIVLIGWHIVSL